MSGGERSGWRGRLQPADLVALGAGLLTLGAMAAPMLAGRTLVARDALQLMAPQQHVTRLALLSGRLPEWNPLVYGGMPHLADPGAGVFYPLNALFLVLPATWAVALFVLMHVPLAFAGAFWLARECGIDRRSSLIAGLGYATSGYLLSMHAMHYAFAGAAWLPLTAAALVHAAERGGRTVAWAAGLWALPVFAGDLQSPLMAAGLGLLVALAGPAGYAVRLGRALSALLLGAALSAVQLVPTLLATSLTLRAEGLSVEVASQWALHPARWLEFFAPAPFGEAMGDGPYWGTAFVNAPRPVPFATTLYVCGALGVLALGVRWRSVMPRLRVLAAVGLLGLLIAAGEWLPLFRPFFEWVPLADRFRYPEKYAVLPTLALVVAGAASLSHAAAGWRRYVPWAAAALLAAGTVVALVAPGLFEPVLTRELPRSGGAVSVDDAVAHLARSLGHGALVCALAGAAVLVARRDLRRGLSLLAALVGLDALVSAPGVLIYGDASYLREPPPMVEQVRQAVAPGTTGRVQRDVQTWRIDLPVEGNRSARSRELDWYSGRENLLNLYGVPYAFGYGPFRPGAQETLYGALLERRPRLISTLFGTAVTVAQDDAGRLQIAPLDSAMQRAQVLPAVAVPPGGLVEAMANRAFDPRRIALVEEPAFQTRDGGGPARVVDETPEALQVHTQGEGGLLVLADTYAEGWSAHLNGGPLPITRVDGLWRGVLVPPGEQTVEFRYRTPGLRAGTVVSLAALVAGLALLAWRGRRPRSEQTG